MNYAEDVGCCLSTSKEDCSRPPCPCNMECWSRDELLAMRKHRLSEHPGARQHTTVPPVQNKRSRRET